VASIDPAKATSLGDGMMGPLLGQPLIGGDPKDEMAPVLAEKFETPDGGKTWIFHVRKGVTFHNGRELTADVVKSNFDRMADEKSGARLAPIFKDRGVTTKVVDPYTFQVNITSGYGSFPSQLTQNAWGAILAPESWKPDGTIDKPIGTGPFVFESWKPGSELRFKAFDKYWQMGEDNRALPYVEGLVMKVVTDPTVRLSALRAKEVDVITHAPIDDASDWIANKPPDGIAFRKYFYNYSDTFHLNAQRPPFQDKRVRQAAMNAVDREELSASVYAGLAELHNQPFKQSSRWSMDVPIGKPDLARAKDLMNQAGLSGGLDVTYLVWSPQYDKIAEVIQAQLSRVGFRVKLEKMDFASWNKRRMTMDFDITQSPLGTLFHPDQPYQFLASTNAAVWSRAGFDDPARDELIAAGRNEVDYDKARAIYTNLVKLIEDGAAPVYLMNAPIVHAYRDALKGYEPIDQGVMALAATNGVHKACGRPRQRLTRGAICLWPRSRLHRGGAPMFRRARSAQAASCCAADSLSPVC
jgi:peptide/nickel transport system substrate-binding protein